MNDSHLKFVLEYYGKYHACSFAMQEKFPEKVREITSVVVNFFDILGDDHQIFTLLETTIDDVAEMYVGSTHDKLKNLRNAVIKYCKQFWSLPEKNFVLTHGDAWCNNLMFKYDGSDVSKFKTFL